MELIVTRLWLMSLQACVLILVVLLAGLLLKKYPKVLSYSLWALVGVRLLCPVFVESSLSLQPDYEKVSQAVLEQADTSQNMAQENPQNVPDSEEPAAGGKSEETGVAENRVLEKNPVSEQEPDRQTEEPPGQQLSGSQVVNTVTEAPATQKDWKLTEILGTVYLAGVCLVAVVYAVQYIRVWNRLRTAVKAEEQVYLSDRVSSPFVIGFLRPRIILPYGLLEEERKYVLLHEKTHIRHHDTLIRGIGVLCLCLHWWNPFVWLAVHIMNKDMEMFCDEAALKHAETAERKAYAETLLHFAARQSGFSLGLAFGESNAEQRIKNIVKKKKRSRIILGAVVIAAVLCGAAFLTIPKQEVGGEPVTGETAGTPTPTTKPQQSPTPTAVAEQKPAHVFAKNEVTVTNPVPDYYTLDTLLEFGTVRTVKGILPGAAPGTWYIGENRGVVYYFGCPEGQSIEQAKLYSYAIFSEEYPLANGIRVGMSKEEILNLYPDMAVVEIDGESYPKDPARSLTFDSTAYPHSYSGDDENLNYQGKEYWHWHYQFDSCLLAEIDAETLQGRAMALALMMRNDKVEAITFYCTNDGSVTPADWSISIPTPWDREKAEGPVIEATTHLLDTEGVLDSKEEQMLEWYQQWLRENAQLLGTRFAVCDVDFDGKDEIIFSVWGPSDDLEDLYTFSTSMFIREYDLETDTLHQELLAPAALGLKIFENGIVAAKSTHNHSYAVQTGRELWPYTLYRYNAATDAYEFLVEVSAWDKYYHPYEFPEEADLDGDGMVYCFTADGSWQDGAAYEAWFVETFGGVAELEISYQELAEVLAEN